MFEICYFVKEVGYEDCGGQWETYGTADTLEKAYDIYDAMKNDARPGDFIEDGKCYIDQIGIYNKATEDFEVKQF